MDNETYYCHYCKDVVELDYAEKDMEGCFKGKRHIYTVHVPVCSICGAELDVPGTDAENDAELIAQYVKLRRKVVSE